MLIEGATNPAPEAPAANPAPEVETETTTTIPESVVDEAPDGSDEYQPTEIADSDNSEGAKADEERLAGLREADYRQKTQLIAEQRKALEARQARLDNVVQQGEALVTALTEEFQSEFGNVDWGKLAAEDPAEYVRKQHALATRQQKLQAAVYKLNQARGAQTQVSQEAQQETLQQQRDALLEKLPELRDESKYAAEAARISKYLSSSGYKPDEVAGVTDHRAVILARKAMMYDELMAKAPKPKPVSSAPPPVAKAPTKSSGPKDWTQMTDAEFAAYRKRQIAQRP